jgi:hypothetical protein
MAASMKRINHQEAYSLNDACTNDAESFFARMRRAEIGHHHHIAGPYLIRFAQELAAKSVVSYASIASSSAFASFKSGVSKPSVNQQ